LLRGGAALLVLLGHVRGFVFIDFAQVDSGHLWVAPFYILTSLGHQAVMLFFALSGFLVGGSALGAIAAGSWDFPDYAIHRFARLWTTVIPALIVTALLDALGRDVLRLQGYGGQYAAILSMGPAFGEETASTLATFLGNVAFLQTIAVPVFGTNGPLWSLAYEFWYYFLVPLAWFAAVAGRAPRARAVAALAVLAALWLLPSAILALAGIWIGGAFAWLMRDRVAALPRTRFRLLFAAILALTLVALVMSLARPGLAGDIALGLACAAALPCLARLPGPGGLYGRLAFHGSEISFTLYVIHFPWLALLWFGLIAPTQYPVGIAGLVVFTALVIAALVWASMMWWAFERHTPRVRRFAQHLFRRAAFRDRLA
jgi:peptidoglycan/LPS O-acetylase OafA/YrhL